MTKTRHLHAILATVHVAIEYDPQDIAALTTLNAQIREQCRKLTGYRDIEIRLGKVPAPVQTAEAITIPMIEPQPFQSDSLAIPAFMARQK